MSVSVRLRAAASDDAAALALVGAATFLETFAGVLDGADIVEHCRVQHAHEVYARWLADPAAAIWLAVADPGGAAVGFAVLAPSDLPVVDPRPGDLELKRIYLLRRFQGTGTGAGLMRAAMGEARRRHATRLLLGVYDGNPRALAFYDKAGFTIIGERHFHVGHHDYHDHVLALELPPIAHS